MAETKWTKEQLDAIYQSGKNIIVSAGAGSGKTAVLTERIIEKLKTGISIDDMIVLTFTNAAAFEMKKRVRDKIVDNLNEYEFLKEQLYLLDQATITTFDSFSLSIVKKYHYLLNIDKNIKIIDNVILTLKKQEIIDEIFNEYYDKKEFLDLLDVYTNKDDENIKKYIINIYDKIDSICKKQEYLDNYMANYYNDNFIDSKITEYMNIINETRDIITILIDNIKNNVNDEILSTFINNIEESLYDLNYCKKFDDYKKILDDYKLPSMPTSKKIDEDEKNEIKNIYDKLKLYIEDIKDLINYRDIDEIKEQLISTKKYANVIVDIIKELDIRLFNYKKEINSYEFSDITRLAIKILEENEYIRNDIKNKTNEIMIDEYQDTNDIGDYFISLISNNNIYMVGDIKQSIYRFRNANPKIFKDKYDSYKNSDKGYAIDLNKNFRSRSEVLNNINLIFDHIMDDDIGGASYKKEHNMFFGNNKYEELGKTNQNYNLEIFNYDYKNYEDNKYYSKDEIEVFMIANDIINRINNHEKVFDMKKGILRDSTYKDFVILVDRKTTFELYKKIFDYMGIPITLHKDEEFVYSNEIYVIKNILKLIDSIKKNNKDDIKYSFISVSRSYLFDYNDSDIFSSVTNDNIMTNEVFKELFNNINELVNKSHYESISNLIIDIYNIFDVYSKSIRIGNVENVNKKLDYIVDVASSLEELGYDLSLFIEYLDNIFDKKIDIQFNSKSDMESNSVNIMTIHKSKGLEYPICYFPQLYKNFNKADLKDRFIFNYNYGIVMPIFNEGLKDTIYKRLLSDNYLKEDISERLRVFYVGLTRAKEKMIMINPINESNELMLPLENDIVNSLIRLKYSSFGDILKSIKSIINPYIVNKDIIVGKEYQKNKDIDLSKIEKDYTDYQDISINIDKNIISKEKYSHTINVIEKGNNEIGTNIHEILEYLDFNNYQDDINNYDLDDFMKEKIIKLFEMPFMKLNNNTQVFKEYEFYYNNSHGIIDLIIENEFEVIIVDYKLKDISKDYYVKQVSEYINYVKTITKKEVKGYLYSIIDENYKII